MGFDADRLSRPEQPQQDGMQSLLMGLMPLFLAIGGKIRGGGAPTGIADSIDPQDPKQVMLGQFAEIRQQLNTPTGGLFEAAPTQIPTPSAAPTAPAVAPQAPVAPNKPPVMPPPRPGRKGKWIMKNGKLVWCDT